MKRFYAIPILCLMLILIAPLAHAQSPGEGSPVIEGNSSGSINLGPLNPLRCLGTDCSRITGLLFPTLVGADPTTANYAPDVQDALALSWDISEDGLEYTFKLRDDLKWSDGEPITAEDVVFSMNAILSNEIDSIYSTTLVDRIAGIEAIDDYTVKITFKEATCTALADSAFPIVPAHAFPDFKSMVDNEFDKTPSVTSGVFSFLQAQPGERIALAANQDYKWSEDGVYPQGFLYVDVPDTTVEVERFLAGELNFTESVPVANRQQVRDSGVQYFDYPANSWSYIGLNSADPKNPQDGLDADGNPIDQGHHPLFGDVRVRRAIQLALDVKGIVDSALFGEGVQMAANELPTSWAADPDLKPVPHDADQAAALLDEAGFPMGPDGIRVANEDALYAEPGTPFKFELITATGSETNTRVGTLVQDQLRQMGIEVEFTPMDFNTMVERSAGQTYDAYLLGWQNSFPVDPDPSGILGPAADVVGFGFNDVSYQNPEVADLMEQARVLPGCDQAARAEIYHQIQRHLQEDQPYIWLFTSQAMYAASPDMQGFAPYANLPLWNVYNWKRLAS
jgi:peptide/nickel transport system substrate-binding protein